MDCKLKVSSCRFFSLLSLGIFLLMMASCQSSLSQTSVLEKRLQQVIEGKDMEVGIAAVLNGQDTVLVHNDVRYPLMSVFKFHQALAVVHTLAAHQIPLDTMLRIEKHELQPDTYSPLRDKCPDANLNMSVRDLLAYTLLWSDNNACDILFNRILDVSQTEYYLKSVEPGHFAIRVNEQQMHDSPDAYLANWTSPLSSTLFLERLLDGSSVRGEYRQFIIDTMLNCSTGLKRLPAYSGSGSARLGHKTGTGGRTPQGKLQAVNDIGFVFLPDGRYYTLSVFIKNSSESMEVSEAVIAEVSETVYQFMLAQK